LTPQPRSTPRAGLPVEGKVERAVKGGYEVRIARHRAFCPISQIDTLRNTDPAGHLGRVYAFRIIEYKEGGKNLVVSRRALLEEEQRVRAVEIRRSIVAGAVLTGRVIRAESSAPCRSGWRVVPPPCRWAVRGLDNMSARPARESSTAGRASVSARSRSPSVNSHRRSVVDGSPKRSG
jgi:hypothetical protein